MKKICALMLAFAASNTYASDDNQVVSIKTDISQQTLIATTKSGVKRIIKIASGKLETPTSTGTFKVTSKEEVHQIHGQSGNPMTWTLFYNGGEAIHSRKTLFNQSWPSSGGCQRILDAGHAKWLFEHTKVGTPVIVTGSTTTVKAVLPWEATEGSKLLIEVPDQKGTYMFNKQLSPELEKILVDVSVDKKLGICKLDPKDESLWFVNFPDVSKMPSPKTLIKTMGRAKGIEESRRRYFSFTELKSIIKSVRGPDTVIKER